MYMRGVMKLVRVLAVAILLALSASTVRQVVAQTGSVIMVDDFESYEDGALPVKWKYLHDKKLVWLEPKYMRPKERFFVITDGHNKALRVHVDGEAVHLSMANEKDGFDWDLNDHPRLAWDWRAIKLPKNAREDEKKLNDTGAGLYVIFKFEGFIIKRPKAIKYAYSATLPVGTVVSYGKLKVIVVSSGADEIGDWQHIDRDVVADYQMVFGDNPPMRPLSLRLWGDSDNTDTLAEADFDNIRMLPPR